MKFRKIVSGVLAFAMVMTSAFTSNVVTVKADETTETPGGGGV